MKIFQILCLLGVTATTSFAQDNQPAPYDSGWFLATNAITPLTVTPTAYPNNANPTFPGGSSAIAEAITPDIAALARNLENDPTRIFNYVHDHIRYVHYFGSHKGAEMTLLERSGNDFDQCALLVALLRAAGFSPNYQFGMVSIPYSAANQQDYQHWVGAMMPNTNWGAAIQLAATINGSFGYPYTSYFYGDTNDVLFHHVWVQVTLNSTNYTLDPAYKVNQPVGGIGLDGAMQLNTNTLISAVSSGSTATADYVQSLNEANLRSTLGSYNSNLLSYIQSTSPNATVQQIVSGQSIVPSTGQPLGQPTPFTVRTQGAQWPVSTWTYIPTSLMAVLSVNLPGTNNSFYLPALAGSRLSIVCTSNGVAQLWQEDNMLTSVQTTGTGATFTPTIGIQHPFGTNWDFTAPGFYPMRFAGDDQSVSAQPYQRTNATYILLYGLDANSAWLTKRQQQLDSYREQGYADSSQQVKTETLNVMGLGWLTQTELAQELLAGQTATIDHFIHRLGRMALETGKGYYIDVYEQVLPTVANYSVDSSATYADNQAFQIGSYFDSAMEHGIIEQLQNSNLVAASTVKLLELASTNAQKIYLATSANWTAGANVSHNISSYDTNSLYTSYISQGYYLLLPQNGSIQIAGSGSWAGSGYVAYQGLPGGAQVSKMIIGGGYNGGYVSDPFSVPSSVYISSTDVNQPVYFNPQSATVSLPTPTGADPVNMVDGSFQVSATDLTLGQTEPRGLSLTRYYSSARRNSNLAGMSPGWVNSYYCTAVPTSAALAGLGDTTPQQMAPMMVAVRTAANIYNSSQPTPKSWVITALIAKWGLDQLINNAVSVNLGKDTIQFVKQPDGSYTPPANCTMSLIKTNGAFWLSERHGRTFKFGTSSLLTNIVDQYGQSLNLTYNASNWVHTVTDWKNRTLTFTYTGPNLTSVSDGTRSVFYGYTGGDLTSFTDAEGKTSSFAYDTNHQIVATFDALSRLVITNSFDAYGHITTQLTQGSTNKTWQIYASGYSTVSVDPAGGQQQYTFDDKSRQTSLQDALGNVTQTVYDGQDHAVTTVSPLNEVSQSVYDGNNNLIQTIDPLNNTNQFFYDSQNRLYLSLDGRSNPTTYGYNAQFSLTGQTNGAGDWLNYAYNSDGTLHTRTDPGGTTTYDGYDSYGQLNHITYPGGLGTESFVNSSFGKVTSHTDGRSLVTTFQYNNRLELTNTIAPTNLTTSVSYDPADNVASTTDARRNFATNTWSVTRHLLTTTLPTVAAGTPVLTKAYDNRDWLAYSLDQLRAATLYTNNLAGWLVSQTDPLQRTTTLGFDPDGRQIAATNAAQEVALQTWDARGKLIALTDGAQHTSLRAYDGAGNQIILTNRNGKVWQFQFDGANRLTNTITPLLRHMSQTWNHQGLVSSTTDPSNQPTYFYYDGKGRLTNRTDNVGAVFYSYDANDNRTSVSGNGLTNTWTNDAYNRASTYTDAYGNLIQYKWDANGNLTNLVYPGGKNVFYTFDNDNHLTQVKDWSGRTTTMTYDLAGKLTTVTRPNGTFRTLNYDSAGELTNVWEQMANSLPIAWCRFNWNSNSTMQWEFAAPLPHTNAPASRSMTYNDDNELKTVDGSSVTVDLDGNLTYGPLTNDNFSACTFDARNRLLNAGGVTNVYDAMNNRIGQTYGTNSISYVINPNAKLPQVLERTKNGVTTYYIYGAGLLYQITETATATNTLTYHYDSRGSTIALTADNGLVVDRFEYSLYATLTYRAGTDDTSFLFNGRLGVMTDPNGLYSMGARFYNPYICRFISADPSGFNGGLNFYAAFNGNPASFLDPTGLGAVSDNTGQTWLTGSSATPTDLTNPFGLNTAEQTPTTGQLFGNGLNNTVTAMGNTVGLALYPPGWTWQNWNQAAAPLYSTATPANPAATPYVEGALAVSGVATTAAGGVGLWGAAGLPTMSVAVGEGVPFHVAYGVGGTWVNAVGSSLGNMTVSTYLASDTAASAYFTVTGIPILNSAAVTATGGAAWTCVTAAGSAFVRGWLP